MRDFIKIQTTFYDKAENKLKFDDYPTFINPLFIMEVTKSKDIEVSGIVYSYFYIQLESTIRYGVSKELETLFGENK